MEMISPAVVWLPSRPRRGKFKLREEDKMAIFFIVVIVIAVF